MNTHLYPPNQWAQMEFSGVKLHDKRYARRLVKIGNQLAARPGGTLPQAFEDWAELKAAYRFFADPRNTFEKLQSPHCNRVVAECKSPGEYLLIEDTTQLDFTGRACEDLGYTTREGRGFFLHTTLAVRVSGWDLNQRPEGTVLGLFHQHCWNRMGRSRNGKETRAQLENRQRESDRWARALVEELVAGQNRESSYVYIADREADFYEPIQRCLASGVDFVIRGYHRRRLADGSETSLEAVSKAPVSGTMAVELRARPAAAARTAVVEVRCLAVTNAGTLPQWKENGRPHGQYLGATRTCATGGSGAAALVLTDIPKLQTLGGDSTRDWPLLRTVVGRGIPQGPQKWSGRGTKSAREAVPTGIFSRGAGDRRCAVGESEVSGSRTARRSGGCETLRHQNPDPAGKALRTASARQMDPPRAGTCHGPNGRVHRETGGRRTWLADHLARLAKALVDDRRSRAFPTLLKLWVMTRSAAMCSW